MAATIENTKEYTREDAVKDAAADETGFPLETVDRVYDLMDKLSEHDAGLKVIDGKVVVDWLDMIGCDDDVQLPPSLWDEIDRLDFEIVKLLEPILRAWRKTFGHPFPVMWQWSRET